jgi:ATP-binding cassette subfamily B protein/ATP-binding cassette subfamily C protein
MEKETVQLDFEKMGGLVPAVVQDDVTQKVLMAEFMEVVNKQPHGMDTFIERWMAEDDDKSTATELSGGQSQRLALARNFYRDAPIMILDEPTSAIDALAESRIFQRLFRQKNKTLIIVSHRLTTVEKADVIYMMEQGRVVESGTHAELVAKKGRYYRMFESQITK